MSRSDRKRSSKWDLTEESRVPPENIEGNGPRRSAVEDNDMNSRKDLGYAAREPLHGSRGSHKYDSINEGRGRHLKATVGWERDESYNMRMSPGLDEWRQRSRSPKNNSSRPIRSKSRSRSRSPVRGYRRESVNFDRDRSRSGVSQLCKDFASGRCRRGNHCPFSHQINENYEDIGESKHRKDGVSKYSSPHEVRDYPARGGRSTSPRGVRDYPTRSGRSPSPHGSRDYPPRGGRSPSPRGARDYPPRGGRSPSPRGARDYPTRGGRSTSPREARDYPARSGRSSEICNNFPKGKCFRGASCRYVHDGASDGFDKVTATESIRERDNDRYNRDASFDRGVERQTLRSDDIPCKFFAAGNCRNSSRCRFSHNGQAHVSTDRRPRDDRVGLHPGSDAGNQIWDGPKWSDTNAVSDAAKLNEDINDKMVPRNSSGDVNQAWDCPRWSDTNTTSDAAKLGEEKTVKMGVYEPNTTAWSSDDRWGQSLFNEKKVPGDPISIHKSAGHAEKDATQWNEQGAGDMEMSPDWKYAVPSANQFRKEEHDYVVHSSQSLVYNIPSVSTHDQSITKEASVPSFAGGASMLPTSDEKYYFQHNPKLMGAGATLLPCDGKGSFERTASSNTDLNHATTALEGQSFEQNGQDSSVLPHSNVNAVGSQVVFIERPGGLSTMNSQDPELHGVGKLAHSPDIASANASQINPVIPQTQNVVTSEQLTQLTNISASLAKLLENGQELPKLYAALNPHSPLGAPSISNLGLPFQPASSSSIQLGTASVLQKQYDPMHDSIDLEKPDVNTTAPGFSADPLKQNTSAICADRKPTVPADAGGRSGGDFNGGNSREELNDEIKPSKQPDTGVSSMVISVNNGDGVDKTKKAPIDTNTQENGPSQNAEKDGGADEGRKSKDGKGIRAFKFALVDLVKELLKPNWKEGQIDKEAYKTIVKKVVDKVTGTIQAANIPQTQEKIEQYLSFSKPKLTKLIQAYVDKFQKGKE